MNKIIFLAVMLSTTISPIQIWGFSDFCYDGTCYVNPSDDIAISLGGMPLSVDWNTVEFLTIRGASLGIGVDPTAERAYTNGTAFGYESMSVDGPDAGTYECGHLYLRMLKVNSCSAFIHVPTNPSISDLKMVKKTLAAVKECNG